MFLAVSAEPLVQDPRELFREQAVCQLLRHGGSWASIFGACTRPDTSEDFIPCGTSAGSAGVPNGDPINDFHTVTSMKFAGKLRGYILRSRTFAFIERQPPNVRVILTFLAIATICLLLLRLTGDETLPHQLFLSSGGGIGVASLIAFRDFLRARDKAAGRKS
jgi:hypothetical protein